MGWQTFAEWIDDYALPVFALGGMQRSDLSYAQQVGAYGIAGIREI
ncbi:MAG: thiamine phosphate synthase [Acinetobacter sp.]|nr:thiamine phosphate synthase [Acinetobacter sp.]